MKHHMPDNHTSHPNVVPLIDIIMCLIIFFMLVAKIGVDTGEDESVSIPYASLGKTIKSLENSLLVNVKEVNNAAEVSAMVDQTSGKGRVPLVLEGGGSGRRLVDVLKRLRFGKDGVPGGTGDNADNPELRLIIRGDSKITFGVLQQVLLAAAQAQVKGLNFQTSNEAKDAG